MENKKLIHKIYKGSLCYIHESEDNGETWSFVKATRNGTLEQMEFQEQQAKVIRNLKS